MIQWLSLDEIKRKYENMQKFAHKCKCGHTVFIANKSGKAECNYCHNLVFKDEITKFKYIMRSKLIEERRKLK